MKNLFTYFISFLVIAVGFTACNDDDDVTDGSSSWNPECYIFTYGQYNSGDASIDAYDYSNDSLVTGYYSSQNGLDLSCNIEGVCSYDDNIYVAGNNSDQLFALTSNLIQNANGVTDSLANPRDCVGNDDYVYVSCWGSSPDYAAMADSYIAVYNISDMAVERKISVPGGPEGIEVANGKLYAGLNYKDSIAVVDLDTYAVSYIATPAVCSSMIKDNSDNIYVALVSTYSDPSDDAGIGYINTTSDDLTTYTLENVSTEYADIMALNSDGSKLYVLAASYDANYNLTGGIQVFDTESQSFESTPLVDDVTGPEGIGVNPDNDDVYLLTAPTTSSDGYLNIYSSAGELQSTHTVGIYPTRLIFN